MTARIASASVLLVSLVCGAAAQANRGTAEATVNGKQFPLVTVVPA